MSHPNHAKMNILHDAGGFTLFCMEVMKTFWRTSGNFRAIMEQINYVSYRSLSTVAFSGVFVGAILVIQFDLMLAKYGAQALLGGLNTSSVVREVGPLIISFLLAGKIGAFTAAELANMRVTQQIDAIRCLGTNPIQFLIVPRFIAIVFSSLILLVISLMVSVLGSILVAKVFAGVDPLLFISSIPKFTGPGTVVAGLFKSFIYGIIVAGVACYKGYTASGGAQGVGRAVTQTAVCTNFFIILANYVTSHLIAAGREIGDTLWNWFSLGAQLWS